MLPSLLLFWKKKLRAVDFIVLENEIKIVLIDEQAINLRARALIECRTDDDDDWMNEYSTHSVVW